MPYILVSIVLYERDFLNCRLAMSQQLPVGSFRWLSDEEIDDLRINLMDVEDDSKADYMLEVDLFYPSDLHDYHNDLPFAP